MYGTANGGRIVKERIPMKGFVVVAVGRFELRELHVTYRGTTRRSGYRIQFEILHHSLYRPTRLVILPDQ